MKVTQALYDKLQPGDLVKIKTPGQLIDSGWKMFGLKTFYCLWDDNNDIHIIHDEMIELLGTQLYIDSVYGQEIFFKGCDKGFTIPMLQEVYPLARGINSIEE